MGQYSHWTLVCTSSQCGIEGYPLHAINPQFPSFFEGRCFAVSFQKENRVVVTILVAVLGCCKVTQDCGWSSAQVFFEFACEHAETMDSIDSGDALQSWYIVFACPPRLSIRSDATIFCCSSNHQKNLHLGSAFALHNSRQPWSDKDPLNCTSCPDLVEYFPLAVNFQSMLCTWHCPCQNARYD